MREVAVLFARADSIYKGMEGVDVWDAERDARKWAGGAPIVGHPPCRAWGGLRHMAKPRSDEKALATWCIDKIREWGGVLEHPQRSQLWPEYGLPEPGERDKWGGFTIAAPQLWWGHPCVKPTRFYICGLEPSEVSVPLHLGYETHAIASSTTRKRMREGRTWVKELSKAGREKTPPALAEWLVDLARRSRRPHESR